MKSFFEKHADKFAAIDALNLIHNKVAKAQCLCNDGKEHVDELVCAYQMLGDYLQLKGVDPKKV